MSPVGPVTATVSFFARFLAWAGFFLGAGLLCAAGFFLGAGLLDCACFFRCAGFLDGAGFRFAGFLGCATTAPRSRGRSAARGP